MDSERKTNGGLTRNCRMATARAGAGEDNGGEQWEQRQRGRL